MTSPPTVRRARELRKRLTPPEARMWVALRPLRSRGFHFRRQAPFRGYILDFVCFERRVCIEIDGQIHMDRGEHDLTRDAVLAREGFVTLRFDNAAVRDNLPDVMDRILEVLNERPSQRPDGANA